MNDEALRYLILSFLDSAGPPDINGAAIAFREVKFQDSQGNTFSVQVLCGLKRGDPVPQGFVGIGILQRTNDHELKPMVILPGDDPNPDYVTRIAFNQSAFPMFIGAAERAV